jgi:hypothetical protein
MGSVGEYGGQPASVMQADSDDFTSVILKEISPGLPYGDQ